MSLPVGLGLAVLIALAGVILVLSTKKRKFRDQYPGLYYDDDAP